MKRVLVIEDSEVQQKLLAGTLEDQGYKVDIEGNGSRAVYRAQEEDYDLILLDIHMPRTNGIMILLEFRANMTSQNTNIIVITKDKRPVIAKLAKKCGAADFMIKPVDVKELKEKVSHWIDKPPIGRNPLLLPTSHRTESKTARKELEREYLEKYFEGHPDLDREAEIHEVDEADKNDKSQDSKEPQEPKELNEIMVVEDSDLHQTLIINILEEEGYKAFAVSNGAKAIEAAKKNKFDLILLDLHMPEVNGIDVLREIKKEGACVDTNVIIVTSEKMPEMEKLARELGACDYLRKPFNTNKFLEKIARWNRKKFEEASTRAEPSKDEEMEDGSGTAEPSGKDKKEKEKEDGKPTSGGGYTRRKGKTSLAGGYKGKKKKTSLADSYDGKGGSDEKDDEEKTWEYERKGPVRESTLDYSGIGKPKPVDSEDGEEEETWDYKRKGPVTEVTLDYSDVGKPKPVDSEDDDEGETWNYAKKRVSRDVTIDYSGTKKNTMEEEQEKRILVVEDSAMQQTVITGCLQSKNYKIDIANNGKKALDLIAWTDYNLILLDINMPQMNGIEVLKAVRPKRRKGGVRIIVVTIESKDTMVMEAIKLGAVDYLVKPFSANQLLEKVNKWIK